MSTDKPGPDTVTFKAGEIVFEEGDEADSAYLIKSGAVQIVKRNPGGDVVLVTLNPNQVFGELSLMDKSPRSAAAIAVEPSVLMQINAEKFQAKLSSLDDFMNNWFRFLKHRILDLSSQVEE